MSEYIKREEALIAVCAACGAVPPEQQEQCAYKFTGCMEAQNIFNIPTADVRENVQGEWQERNGKPEAVCPFCGREVVYQAIDGKYDYENYCPHCGAKLRGANK